MKVVSGGGGVPWGPMALWWRAGCSDSTAASPIITGLPRLAKAAAALHG